MVSIVPNPKPDSSARNSLPGSEEVGTKRYSFEEVNSCEMCGHATSNHKVMGQRLNQSQGFWPKRKTGVSVSVRRCSNCGLIYSSPQPVPLDLQDHYGIQPEDYWKPEYFRVEDAYFSRQIAAVKRLLPFAQNMIALDVGSGIGKGIIALERAGFTTYGFEPSISFYQKATAEMGVNPERLLLGSIEEVHYEDSFFDLITFGAVFEHLSHPARNLEKALRWLKPNGIIHMEVPSSRWLISKMVNLYYTFIGTDYVTNLSPMHVPFHLYEFDLRSFHALGRRLGFTVVEHYFDVCQIFYFPKFMHPLLRQFMKWTNTGMQLTVYLKKNELSEIEWSRDRRG